MRHFVEPHDAVRNALWREMANDPVLASPPIALESSMADQRHTVWRRVARAVETGLAVNNPNFVRKVRLRLP